MTRLYVIGIGAGDPTTVTIEAITAMNAVDVFLVLDKGDGRDQLGEQRREILRTHLRGGSHRIVQVTDTRRDPSLPYEDGVRVWHLDRVTMVESAIAEHAGDDASMGILVWGDPGVYDSTLRIVDQIIERGVVPIEVTVVPGISSIQLLTARHHLTLNRIGRSVLMTTGRLLDRGGVPEGVDDVVVLLDASTTFRTLVGKGWEIFWGAYLGSPDEILIAGPLDVVAERIVVARSEARDRLGWMFDIYLLRRLDPG